MLHFPEKSREKPSDLQNFGLRIDIYARKHPKVSLFYLKKYVTNVYPCLFSVLLRTLHGAKILLLSSIFSILFWSVDQRSKCRTRVDRTRDVIASRGSFRTRSLVNIHTWFVQICFTDADIFHRRFILLVFHRR